ncbi:MAG: carboxymuconolactone decarboxylase family protein [Psittacicella sp.]
MEFIRHNLETAPKESLEILERSKKAMGIIPGLYSVMAESPEILKAYTELHQLFMNSAFDKDELTVVWQTINIEHNCTYCVPAHTAIAYSMGVSEELVNALREEKPLPNKKLEMLRTTTLRVVRQRGFLTDEEISEFYSVGYTTRNLLDIVLGLSQKVISNYVNHLSRAKADSIFEKFEWTKAK